MEQKKSPRHSRALRVVESERFELSSKQGINMLSTGLANF